MSVPNFHPNGFTQSEVSAADVISRMSEIQQGTFCEQKQNEAIHFTKTKCDNSNEIDLTKNMEILIPIPKEFSVIISPVSKNCSKNDPVIPKKGQEEIKTLLEHNRKEDAVKHLYKSLGMYEDIKIDKNTPVKKEKYEIELEEDCKDSKSVFEEFQNLKSFLKMESNVTMLTVMISLLKKEISVIHDQLTKSENDNEYNENTISSEINSKYNSKENPVMKPSVENSGSKATPYHETIDSLNMQKEQRETNILLEINKNDDTDKRSYELFNRSDGDVKSEENTLLKSVKYEIELERDSCDAERVLEEFQNLQSFLKIESNVTMLNIMLTLLKKEINVIHDQLIRTQNEEFDENSAQGNSKSNHEGISIEKSASKSKLTSSKKVNEKLSVRSSSSYATTSGHLPQQMTIMEEFSLLGKVTKKTIKLAEDWMEFVTKQKQYICGYFNGEEKLADFLKLYQEVTGSSSFTIRRSKSKPSCESEDTEEKQNQIYKPGYLGKGQIKWEKNIGIPPIPFTGVPFTTEGGITYQCEYGPKRTNNDRSTLTQAEVPQCKKIRLSKKKDCPAEIHVRTVHSFPEYNCLLPENSNNHIKDYNINYFRNSDTLRKNQRAIMLSRLREDLVQGQVKIQQGFWIRIPLPEVHLNHTLGPFTNEDEDS